ncbi:MAG: hypothetical protein AB1421_08425 [Pseudomonadota bacterium]
MPPLRPLQARPAAECSTPPARPSRNTPLPAQHGSGQPLDPDQWLTPDHRALLATLARWLDEPSTSE